MIDKSFIGERNCLTQSSFENRQDYIFVLVRLFNVSTGESVDHVALNIRFFFSFLYWWMLIFFVCVWLTGCCCCLGFALLFRSLAQRDSTKGQHNEYPTFSTAVAFSYSPPLSIVSSLGFFPLPKRPGVSFSRWEEAPLLFSPDSKCYVNRITSHLIGK